MKQTGLIPSAKYAECVFGHKGRPSHYPSIIREDGLLFYIQRNQNINTVIYTVNTKSGGVVDLCEPISIQWIKYKDDGSQETQDINYIQRKLAYGYNHTVISNELIEFVFVSYSDLKFYICRSGDSHFVVKARFAQNLIEIDHIYVFAEDLGVFPQVKFVEIFGWTEDDHQPFYHKIKFDHH